MFTIEYVAGPWDGNQVEVSAVPPTMHTPMRGDFYGYDYNRWGTYRRANILIGGAFLFFWEGEDTG